MAINFTSSYSQNFDTLANSGTSNLWENNSTLPGWYLFRQPAPGTAVANYQGNDGNSSTGSFYSYGSTSSNERALGGIGSGSFAGWMAFAATNTTGSSIDSLDVVFNGEQWRNGGNTTAQTMTLEYGFGSTFDSVSNWITPGGNFNFTSPVATSSAAAVDGNGTGRENGLGGTLSSLNWANNSTLWLRWVENNDTANDHGLAIDDFSINASVSTPTVNIAPLLGISSNLYNNNLNTLPSTQGWSYTSLPLPGIAPTFANGVTNVNTLLNANFYAGFARADQILDRTQGYSLNFTAQVLNETRTNTADKNTDGLDDRAGFSVILLSNDATPLGIELGFFSNTIWAQESGTTSTDPNLFTQAESVTFDTSTNPVDYQLTVIGNTYTIQARDIVTNATATLSGSLRNYTPFQGPIDPYETPNFIFFGDNTTSAAANFNLGSIALTTVRNNITVAENTTSVVNFTVIDVNGDIPTLSITGGADQLLFSIDNNTGVLSFNNAPDFEEIGDSDSNNIYVVEVTANDGNGGITTETINVTVSDVNEAPTVANIISDQSATAGSNFSFQFANNVFNDVDALDTLTYTATLANDNPLPAWLTFDAANRTFSGTPPTAATLSVKVIATDSGNASVEDVFDVVISPATQGTPTQGTSGSDRLTGTAGDDNINGLEGNDYIFGRDGNDNLEGGTGRDYIFGGAGDDSVSGGDGNDLIYGGAGNDILNGGGGDDNLNGDEGDDILAGGIGNDIYTVDSINDQVIELSGEGIDQIKSSVTWDLNNSANVEKLTLIGNNPIDGTGNDLNNHIIGNNAVNTLNGGDGDDWLMGRGGDDILIGGNGNDRLNGGTGDDILNGGLGNDIYEVDSPGDTIIETTDAGIDTVISVIDWSLADNLENLTLVGNQAVFGVGNNADNRINGNNADNFLLGLDGDDQLFGSNGDDLLIGGLGFDRLVGGRGADTFDLTDVLAGGFDTVVDFNPAEDIIHLSGDEFGLGAGTLDASLFSLGTSATLGSDRFIYNQAKGELFYDADGVGGADQVQIALFSNRVALDNTNFQIVNL